MKGRILIAPGEYTEKALGHTHNGIYGLGEWRELIDENHQFFRLEEGLNDQAYPDTLKCFPN